MPQKEENRDKIISRKGKCQNAEHKPDLPVQNTRYKKTEWTKRRLLLGQGKIETEKYLSPDFSHSSNRKEASKCGKKTILWKQATREQLLSFPTMPFH
jgi:hypothetical protein